MARILLSAVVLIISNLIVGSISLSLGLIVAVLAAAVAVMVMVLLAMLGFCIILEKIGWLSVGWTDTRIDRLRAWANEKWQNMPAWYTEEKKKIIEMTIEMLKGKEREVDEPVRMWKWVVAGLVILLAVMLIKQTLHISVGWSILLVAVGSIFVAIPVAYFSNHAKRENAAQASDQTDKPVVGLSCPSQPPSEEVNEALKVLLELHRKGVLKRLLDAGKPETQSQASSGNDNQ